MDLACSTRLILSGPDPEYIYIYQNGYLVLLICLPLSYVITWNTARFLTGFCFAGLNARLVSRIITRLITRRTTGLIIRYIIVGLISMLFVGLLRCF